MIWLSFLAYSFGLAVLLALRGARPPLSAAVGPSAGAAMKVRRVLIVGSTGGTGRQLVARALERGYEVTALARNPAALAMEHPQLTVVRGDVLDRASLDAAVHGQDAVVSALGHKQFYRPTRIQSAGTANLLAVMAGHGVRRFVCETSLGLGDSAGRLGLLFTLFVIPVILPFYFWDKARQERIISESAAHWTIVRPGTLTNGPRRGRYRHGRVGNLLWGGWIARADVADFMLNQLESDTYLKAAPGICS
ncbi:MAG: SDR family oxidoreductase [Candidatus Koribacter versatilis]|uniref:SDR family oxidoreductase n=1 Tax=Candidatus Korobacter versatilis TaxID=658062 RepID=A0A932EPN3_9BACT|nr:SDR family oxidoreductase [Candidatus Koribacter versatilis]